MKKYLFVTSVIFIAFFVSCTPPVYLPNSLNVPLLKEKEETNFGYNKPLDGHDLQISLAITENIGLMINGTYLQKTWSDNYREHLFAELGIGFFSYHDEYLVHEIYIGAGLGGNSLKEDILFGSEDARVSANYIRLFLQPILGTRTKGLECGVSMRICYINFYNIKDSNIDFSKTKLLFEPVVFMRVGPPVLQFQTQFGFSLDPFKDALEIPLYNEFTFSFGFNIRPNIK
jgi:hypothetical protein